jgi:uncharacterized protein (DUF983 family)
MSLLSVVNGKCPKCKSEKIFNKKGNLLLFKIPKMHSKCNKCDFLFDKEAGFFFGAMFVSYALIVAQAVTLFVILHVFLDLSYLVTFISVIVLITLIGTINYRLARIIWIYLFYAEDD